MTLSPVEFNTALQSGTTTERALALFDSLPPVDLAFMMGRWRGAGYPTGHPMDGLLEAANWYGKDFVDPDWVHPLLFQDGNGKIFKVAPNPTLMDWLLRLPIPKNNALQPVVSGFSTLLKTDEPKARLRMMEHRGQVSATMIYDHLPIHDVFRKVNENTVLGLMDYRKSPQPFFFVLRREVPQ
ncbi:MAG: DUF4334 domain-containing protein [Cyanobacteria bacterium P01_A01_bin.135]